MPDAPEQQAQGQKPQETVRARSRDVATTVRALVRIVPIRLCLAGLEGTLIPLRSNLPLLAKPSKD
jgi:hypothetical protein